MTIVILSQRRMATAMSCRIKRASRAGLVGLAVADLLCCVAALAVTYGRDDQAAAYSERGQVRLLTAIYGPFVHHTTVNSDVCTVLLDDMLFAISNSLSFSDCTLFQPSTETLPHACFVHYMKLFFLGLNGATPK